MLSENFYEEYGREWATPLRAAHEKLCSRSKFDDWVKVIPSSLEINSFIDFGCGNGVFLDSFARGKKISAIGIDISQSMIAAARQKFPGYEFILGSIDTLRRENLTADVIFFNDVLEHLKHPLEHLVWARNAAKYVGVRIPLEKTWLIAALNVLRLKEPISRLYYTEGHLYEFSKSEVHALIQRSGLTLLAETTVNDSKEIVFHPYIKDRMRQQPGSTGQLRYGLYRVMENLPYGMTSSVLRPIKGSTLVAFCKT
jgi:2-polyprenyl-3-methyl-5-hydroxy-6-metoxy-1,4-benzoquinol methylase